MALKSLKIGESLADSLEIHLAKVELKDKIDLSTMSLKMDLPDYNIRLTTNVHFSTWLSKNLCLCQKTCIYKLLKLEI